MTELVWDEVGDRLFETGVDRGVLYTPVGSDGVAWNGLTSVVNNSTVENKSFYLDGVKYLETQIPGDFVGQLLAYTYPDEFEECVGAVTTASGVTIYNQKPKIFGLSYRTRIGDDIEGVERGYKIHILYNLIATPESITYATLTQNTEPLTFSWILNSVPANVPGYRPTAHISIDSTKFTPEVMAAIEDKLYGSDINDAYLPPMEEFLDWIEQLVIATGAVILITDNGDGTWTAEGPDTFITTPETNKFQITHINAVYLNPDEYEASST